MDRYEAERLEKRKKGFCYWFGKGKDINSPNRPELIFPRSNQETNKNTDKSNPGGKERGKIAANLVTTANSSIPKMMWCYIRIGVNTMWQGEKVSLERIVGSRMMQLV